MEESVARRAVTSVENGWTRHFIETLTLGIPLIGAQLAQLGINTTDVLIVGHLGTAQLAAIVLASQYFFTAFIFGSGFATAVVPMAAHAHARGDVVTVRRSVRMGLWVVLAFFVLLIPYIWFGRDVLLLLKQDPEVAALAGGYIRIMGWGMMPALVFMALRSFLSAVGRSGFILVVTVITLLLNAFFAYGLVLGHFGMPALGMSGAAIVALGVNIAGMLLTIFYIESRPELRVYELFVRFWRPDWHVFWEVFRLGLPISLSILAEVSLFTVATILMGWIGTVEVAAHGIALQWASIAFMIPLGLAQAATVRVGFASGKGDVTALVRAAGAALILSMAFSAVGGLLYALIPEFFASLYLDRSHPDAPAVLEFATQLVMIAGIFQLVDGLQAVGTGLLRGIKDTRIPMMIAVLSYWLVGFDLAWAFAFPLHFGGIGIWFGFVFGLATAAVLLLSRFYYKIADMKKAA